LIAGVAAPTARSACGTADSRTARTLQYPCGVDRDSFLTNDTPPSPGRTLKAAGQERQRRVLAANPFVWPAVHGGAHKLAGAMEGLNALAAWGGAYDSPVSVGVMSLAAGGVAALALTGWRCKQRRLRQQVSSTVDSRLAAPLFLDVMLISHAV
jgi:hypothetical protein